jgi:hypothetical protein
MHPDECAGAEVPLVEMAQGRLEFRGPAMDSGELTKLLGITAEDLHQPLSVEIASAGRLRGIGGRAQPLIADVSLS